MDDVFRAIFGLPRRHNPNPRFPGDHQPPEAPSSSDIFDFDDAPVAPGGSEDFDGSFPFGGGFGDSNTFTFTHPDDIFRHFDEMFAKFDHMFRGFGMPSVDRGPGEEGIIPAFPPPGGHEVNPRDRMLKQPELVPPPSVLPAPSDPWRHDDRAPVHKPGFFGRMWSNPLWDQKTDTYRDADLDDSVRSGGLDTIFGEQKPDTGEIVPEHRVTPAVPNPGTGSAYRSVSVQTRRGPDGKTEERRTMVDSSGNEQTIVSRTLDGHTVRQTTKRSKTGEVEVVEDLINMDEKDRDSFEQKWQTPAAKFGTRSPRTVQPRNEVLRELDPQTQDSSLFERLFGFRFPGANK